MPRCPNGSRKSCNFGNFSKDYLNYIWKHLTNHN